MGADEIRSLGAWPTNGALIADVARLGYLPEPVLDLTYNEGKFWTEYRPADLTTNDLDEGWPTDFHEDFRATGFEEGKFRTVVFDPPYKLSGTPALGRFDRSYGISVARSKSAILSLIVGGLAEAARISTDFVLVKVQDQVNGGEMRWEVDLVSDVARSLELRKVDLFRIQSHGLPQDPARGQQHARHDYSTLVVLGRKTAKRADRPAPTAAGLFDA